MPDRRGCDPVTSPQPDDEPLRDLFQAMPRTTPDEGECPRPEELWAAARGEADPRLARQVIDHTAICTSCAEDWRLARLLIARVPGSGARRPHSKMRAGRWAAAAALVVGVLGGGWLFVQNRVGPSARRLPGAPTIESLLPEDTPISRDGPQLSWTGPEGATYRLLVTDEHLRVLVSEAGLTSTEYRLPETIVAEIPGGTVLLWKLEASLPDGRRLSSATFRTQLE